MAPLTFSAGIPAFNQGSFLAETVESLLQQTHMPLEIVISDHFSTDNTAEVIADYAARYPNLIRGTQPPPGSDISQQWNHTFSSLRGDWLTLLSSDDVAYPNFVETFLTSASRHPRAALVRAAWRNIDARGKPLSEEFLLSVKKQTSCPESLLEQRHGPKASFAAFAVSRLLLEQSGGYPRGFRSFGDWPLFVQLAPYGDFIYENRIVAGYRIGHDGDKFRNRIALWIHDEVRMFTEVFPRAAAEANLTDTSWIGQASRDNFLRYLAAACERYVPAERAPIAPLFQQWAELTGQTDLLHRFATGENVRRPVPLRERAKNLIRPAVQKAYALVRGN